MYLKALIRDLISSIPGANAFFLSCYHTIYYTILHGLHLRIPVSLFGKLWYSYYCRVELLTGYYMVRSILERFLFFGQVF